VPSFFGVVDVVGTIANLSLVSKFESLGMGNEEVDALVQFLKHPSRVEAGADIVYAEQSAGYSTLLLSGVACSYKRSESGIRLIYSFQYPGEFCDLYRYLLPEWDETLAVQALAECSIATIAYSEIKRLLVQRPRLRLALWRATVLEASILRQWLSNARRGSAVQRVANLICEQLVRREAIGIASPILPVTQVDVADAASLSIVHVNRIIQTLRNWNVLSKASHAIEVVDRKQLSKIAGFDGRYLERAGSRLEVVPSDRTRA
jgi:CRP-like cAMP-binding protein